MFIKSPFTLVLLLATLGFCATSQASVGPEIAVQQPAGTDLVDGTASIDFGNQTLTTSSAAKTFTITNSGLLDLAVTNIVTDGANASDFAVDTTGMLNRLVSGASTTFTVTFTPGANGVRTAAIHINNNDSNEDPFDINLTGTSMDYSVTTTPNSIVVTAISTNSETLTVSEPSAGNINFAAAGRIFCVNGGTSFSGDSGTNSLAGISSITVNASADIVNLGTFVGTLPSLTMNGSSFNAGAIGLQTNSALTINVTNASAITGIVSGVNATLTKGGSGTLTLSGTNTYSGATTISQGILKMGNVSALGSVTVGTTVSDGATIDLNGISLATEPITLNGVGVGATGAVTNSAAATARINGTATLASDTIITVGNGTIEIPGKVTGPGGMIKQGNGFLTLSATNDYAGVTTLNAGIITIQRNGALGSSSGKTVVNSTARLNFQMALNDSYSIPEPVDLNNGGTMSATFNPEIFTGPITLTGTSTMSLG
ncbi:MAG: hypothetical protein JWM68_5074, partial [Verrucomicrobiales bacterium]|nr:hypothetical protein [Verrucomicrobiales bacterium]